MKQKTISLFTLFVLFLFLSCSKKNNEELELLFDESSGNGEVVEEVTDLQQEQSVAESNNAIDDYQKYYNERGRFVVQIGLFRKVSFANRLKSVVENKGIPTFIKKISQPTKDLNDDLYYRVRVGPFDSKGDAKTFAKGHLGEYYYWVDIVR